MALTTSSDIAVLLLAKYVEEQIRKGLRAALILPKFCAQGDLRGKKSKTWSVPQWPTLTAAGVAENASIVSTTVTPTADDISVSEVGIGVDLTDLSQETGDVSPDQYAQQGVIAVKHKMESDIGALLSGFSTSVGSTGVELSLDTLIDAMKEKEDNNDVEDPSVFVLAPRQVAAYRKLIAGASGSQAAYFASGVVDPAVKTIPGYVDTFLGVPIFMSPYVPKINADVDYSGVLMSLGALGMAILRDVRVEPGRDAKARVTELVVTSAYGVGELDDDKGIRVISKVAA